MLKRLLVLAALIFTAGLTAAVVGTSTSAAGGHVKNFKHIFIIMMENTGIEALQGNPNAPWINQAIQADGVAGNYFGVTHPSQPNYVAATAGTTSGVPDDNDVTVNLTNIVDQLEANGHTWKAYMQGLSLCNGNKLAHACGNQLYERKHDPFVSFSDVQSNPARLANIVDLSQLDTDLAGSGNSVPDYAWISPDQCNDMHGRGGGGSSDPCDFSNVPLLIQAGDTFLHRWVDKITSSKAWSGDSAIVITWDESDFTGSPNNFGFGDTRGCCDSNPGGGHVLTIVIQRNSNGPSASYQLYNHYSLLSTVEDSWNLGCLGFTCDTANVKPMSDLTG